MIDVHWPSGIKKADSSQTPSSLQDLAFQSHIQQISLPPEQISSAHHILSHLHEYNPFSSVHVYNLNSELTLYGFHYIDFGVSWTADDCAKRLLGLEISLPTIGAAAGSVLLLLRCHGECMTSYTMVLCVELTSFHAIWSSHCMSPPRLALLLLQRLMEPVL